MKRKQAKQFSTLFQIAFEGTVGQGYAGDIAIDDIKLQPGTCPPPGSCNFEYDTCGYFNVHDIDNFDWLRSAGGTITTGTGPAVDHTTNSDAGEMVDLVCSARAIVDFMMIVRVIDLTMTVRDFVQFKPTILCYLTHFSDVTL